MGIYLRPEYFQTIHYYFFAIGIFTLTDAFLFSYSSMISYLLFGFYALDSVISWRISWTMQRRMKDLMVMQSRRYWSSHIILTVWSAGLAVALWLAFEADAEALLFSILMINFFLVFLGGIWYAFSRFRIAGRYFEWQEGKTIGSGKSALLSFRKKSRLRLVDDQVISGYRKGAIPSVDQLFSRMSGRQRGEDAAAIAGHFREIELKLCEARIRELERKLDSARKAGGREAPRAAATYAELIDSYRKRVPEYDKAFNSRFGR